MREEITYVNLTELGRVFGMTSHGIGKLLKIIGLRESNGKPSSKAFHEGYCEQAPTNRGTGYYYVWHREKIIHALEEAGCKRVL
jgi:hypothetical protein